MKSMKLTILLAVACFPCALSFAQEKPLEMKMDFEEYDPPSTLAVAEHHLTRAKFPFIDIHNHQGNMNTADLTDLVKEMDKLNMKVMNNLSGYGFRGGSDHLEKSLENIKRQYPDRLSSFPILTLAISTILSGQHEQLHNWSGMLNKAPKG